MDTILVRGYLPATDTHTITMVAWDVPSLEFQAVSMVQNGLDVEFEFFS